MHMQTAARTLVEHIRRADPRQQSGQPFGGGTSHVLDAAVTDVGEHLMPVLGAFTAAAGPQAQDVAFAVDGDADDDVVPVRNNWSVACRCGQ